MAKPIGRITIKKARNEKYWYAGFYVNWSFLVSEDCGDRWKVLYRWGTDKPGTEYWVDKEDAILEALEPEDQEE